MKKNDYLHMLVDEFHSAVVATTGKDGHPQTRVIDMMLWDSRGVYFLTARGKEFYDQLMDQEFVALSAAKDKKAISLRGKIKNIGKEKLDEIFEKNPYMKEIYPGNTQTPLEVFCLYQGQGEYFDISIPSQVRRESFAIGQASQIETGYFVGRGCIGCKLCYSVCPQKCIDISGGTAVIRQEQCLHCGQCAEICPEQIIERRG